MLLPILSLYRPRWRVVCWSSHQIVCHYIGAIFSFWKETRAQTLSQLNERELCPLYEREQAQVCGRWCTDSLEEAWGNNIWQQESILSVKYFSFFAARLTFIRRYLLRWFHWLHLGLLEATRNHKYIATFTASVSKSIILILCPSSKALYVQFTCTYRFISQFCKKCLKIFR